MATPTDTANAFEAMTAPPVAASLSSDLPLDVIPNRRMSLEECAIFLRRSAAHLKKIAQDQRRKPQERRFIEATHRAYPQFQKYGPREWGCYGPILRKHIEEQG